MNPTSRAALLLLALASPAFLSGCAPAPETAGPAALDPATGTGAIEELVAMMSGSFSSGAQAAEDERFRDIRLQMRRVWPEREDGYWLYVEQAAAGAPGKPYRQRFYRLYESEPGWYVSAVYEMEEPLRFAGAHADLALLADLTPKDLSIKAGCELALSRNEQGVYAGETDWETCPSSLFGASFATSEVTITEERLESWDRGWDAAGEQVWGSEAGAYRFDRLEVWPIE